MYFAIQFIKGAIKKYIVTTLTQPPENIPNAIDSVDVLSSWKLEHWMIQWMDAYRWEGYN